MEPNGLQRKVGETTPLLGQGGVAAPRIKCREASLAGADGVVGSTTDEVADRTTPSAPTMEASRQLDQCRVHPSLAKEGNRLALP